MGGSSAAWRRRGLGDAAGTPIRRALRPVVAVCTCRGAGACRLERRVTHTLSPVVWGWRRRLLRLAAGPLPFFRLCRHVDYPYRTTFLPLFTEHSWHCTVLPPPRRRGPRAGVRPVKIRVDLADGSDLRALRPSWQLRSVPASVRAPWTLCTVHRGQTVVRACASTSPRPGPRRER